MQLFYFIAQSFESSAPF